MERSEKQFRELVQPHSRAVIRWPKLQCDGLWLWAQRLCPCTGAVNFSQPGVKMGSEIGLNGVRLNGIEWSPSVLETAE